MAESRQERTKFTAIFASGTMVSRVLGLVRDVVWFHLIPTAALGPFLVAFRFPNMLRELIGEGAANAAFVPAFTETLEKEGKEEFRRFVSAAMSVMLILLVVLTFLGVLLLPLILKASDALHVVMQSETLSQENMAHTINLAQWVFPYLFFIGMAVFAMGPLFTIKHYATPSWSPALLNIAFIACCIALINTVTEPAYALVAGVWLGGIAQMIVNYAALAKHTGVRSPNFQLNHPGIPTVFWLLVPVVLGQATSEVNKLVDALFAFQLGPHAVKALYAGNRLVQLPLSLFGLAVAAAMLPAASRAAARDDHQEVRRTVMEGLLQSFFLVFPAMLGLIALRVPIMRLLFERGEFSPNDTAMAATALGFYGAGLLSFAWVRISVTGFYAIQNTKTPAIVASLSMLLNIVLNFALVGPLGYKGLALATTISFTVNFLGVYLLLCRKFGKLWDRPFLTELGKIAIASILMTGVAVAVWKMVGNIDVGPPFVAPLLAVLIPIGAGLVFYLGVCKLMAVRELRHFTSLIGSKTE